MSTQVVREILDRARNDAAFYAALRQDPVATLKPYDSRLTVAEKQALSAMPTDLVDALGPQPAPSRHSWWPTSFKELGAATLSLVLIGLLIYAVIASFVAARAGLIVVEVGEAQHVVDGFERSKELLNILFPLFGAVITFWLGVAIEARRADENADKADQEAAARENADQAKEDAKVNASTALARVEGVLAAAAVPPRKADDTGPPLLAVDRDALLAMVRAGLQAL